MALSVRFCCVLLLTLLVLQHSYCVSVSQICQHRCLYGRGGILCNCNAMHFAGKRNKPHALYATPLSPTEASRFEGDASEGRDGDSGEVRGHQRLRFGSEGSDEGKDAVRSYLLSHRGNAGNAGFYANGEAALANNAGAASLIRDRQREPAHVYLYPDGPIDNSSPNALHAGDVLPGTWDRDAIDNFVAALETNEAAPELSKDFSPHNDNDGVPEDGVSNGGNRRETILSSPEMLLARLPYLVFADRLSKLREGRQRKGENSIPSLTSDVGTPTSSNAVHRNHRQPITAPSSDDVREEMRSRKKEHMAELRRILHQAINKREFFNKALVEVWHKNNNRWYSQERAGWNQYLDNYKKRHRGLKEE